MPYIEELQEIRTNVIGVTLADDFKGRQSILEEMLMYPQDVKQMYVTKQGYVYVAMETDRLYCIGQIKDKYFEVIGEYNRIVSWLITGGNYIEEKKIMGNYGINIKIKLDGQNKGKIPGVLQPLSKGKSRKDLQ